MVSPVHPENLERLEKQGHLVSQEFQDPRETRVLLDLREALDFKGLEVNTEILSKPNLSVIINFSGFFES